ncbi:hypothetical protein GCM10022295_91150 [Streptomyces osmaniensis]|uniref:Secreted protein n=1 Tax=Streptomyces osmaniensis TaxID=593134 RepID=A0ABP6Z4H7_9ACTN
MVLAIDVMVVGLQRALRRMRQVLTGVMVLSMGRLGWEWARLTRLCLVVRFFPGRRLWGTARDVAGSLVAGVGRDGDAEPDAGGDDPVPACRGQVVGPARRGG